MTIDCSDARGSEIVSEKSKWASVDASANYSVRKSWECAFFFAKSSGEISKSSSWTCLSAVSSESVNKKSLSANKETRFGDIRPVIIGRAALNASPCGGVRKVSHTTELEASFSSYISKIVSRTGLNTHVGSIVCKMHDRSCGTCASDFTVFIQWTGIMIIGTSNYTEWSWVIFVESVWWTWSYTLSI